MKAKSTYKMFTEYLNYLWGTVVHVSQKGKCQVCGRKGIEPHHYYSRKRLNTRYDTRNGVLLCRACHNWKGHGDEIAKEPIKQYLINKLGMEEFTALGIRARINVQKLDRFAIELQLLDELSKFAKIPEHYHTWVIPKRIKFLRALRKQVSEATET